MKSTPLTKEESVDIAGESVAGEEDPGASIDTTVANNSASQTTGTTAANADANLCPRCGGTGRVPQGRCPDCAGTGKLKPASSSA